MRDFDERPLAWHWIVLCCLLSTRLPHTPFFNEVLSWASYSLLLNSFGAISMRHDFYQLFFCSKIDVILTSEGPYHTLPQGSSSLSHLLPQSRPILRIPPFLNTILAQANIPQVLTLIVTENIAPVPCHIHCVPKQDPPTHTVSHWLWPPSSLNPLSLARLQVDLSSFRTLLP